ncbi:hypothetical protein LTR78_001969 [Recurvomyces mirabilis]|uniref:RING-type domain-containing protein n=1 Tax=Recurvomyces mirabilis TaxID=574656 RepID=A0AAE0WUJ4_9PEZI|nr:hypothetical protein LTR78_001969 [Recurvomyces mirabilis]KAK5160427.1 hypothetical protein LTS14_001439 [Recurvomyces mirabilis]
MIARAAIREEPEVIDLLSDDSVPSSATPQTRTPLDLDEDGNLSPLHDLPYGVFHDFDDLEDDLPVPVAAEPLHRGQYINIDGEDIFIPDEEEVPPVQGDATELDAELAAALSNEQADGGAQAGAADFALVDEEITADSCLQRVLEIFPDVDHEHIRKLWADFDSNEDYESLSGSGRLDNIINQLVSATSYPKAEKGKQATHKRKREDSIDENDFKQWEDVDRHETPAYLKGNIRHILKSEFPEFPVQYINDILSQHKHVYQSYMALAAAKDRKDPAAGRGRPSTRNLADANNTAVNTGWPVLPLELDAARKKVVEIRAGYAREGRRKRLEEENLQKAKDAGEITECSACCDDLPMNRQIHCDGTIAHFICFECIETYISSEVGEARCRVLCTAGCSAPYPPNQLNLLSNKQLLAKLAELEQEKAIRDAELEDLEECPCCDYKAILPPIEEDFEFRCANPECEMVTCRRCKAKSHIPLSCEEHAKDNKLKSQHTVEEAMTAALVRSCNKCKKQFIKQDGCNKMTCPSCSNLQCYVCSQSITSYDHFDQTPHRANVTGGNGKKKCPLYDANGVEERHEREVKEAEEAARRKVLEENPDVQQEDLEIKVSDAVKKVTSGRADGVAGLGGGWMAGLYAGAGVLGGFDGMNDALDEQFQRVNQMHARQIRDADAEARGRAYRRNAEDRAARRARLARAAEAAVAAEDALALAPAPVPAVQGFIPVVAAAPGGIGGGGWPGYPNPYLDQTAGLQAGANQHVAALPAGGGYNAWGDNMLDALHLARLPDPNAYPGFDPIVPVNNHLAAAPGDMNRDRERQDRLGQLYGVYADRLDLVRRPAPAQPPQAGMNPQQPNQQQARDAALQDLRADRDQRMQRIRDQLQQERLLVNLQGQQRFHQQHGLNDRLQRQQLLHQQLALQRQQQAEDILSLAAYRNNAARGRPGDAQQ